uniref:MULE transposase domain-containing protein n=1 Tax=Lactuca sativa TaxID=4236 RepID=A0A9R1W2X9_LACSA|nr:hypothetical protein LSAT_V11C300146980 [Lactuca sativa]
MSLLQLENLFFVHPTSWKIWRAFPHVLIIDATYKTNKYNKPVVQIVGVTSTQKTFSVGFALIHREKGGPLYLGVKLSKFVA